MSKPIVKFAVAKVDSKHYEASALVPCANGTKMCIVAKTRICVTSLSRLLASLRNNLQTKLFAINRFDPNVPKSGIKFIFDGNLSRCPDFAEQETVKPTVEPVIKEDLALYEVKKINNMWTIVKHDTPLLSKQEATDLLFAKIGG